MSASAAELERLVALLVDRALAGLRAEEEAELAALSASFPDLDDAALDRTAAQIDLALAADAPAPLDPETRRAILDDAQARFGAAPPSLGARLRGRERSEAAPRGEPRWQTRAHESAREASHGARAASPAAGFFAPRPARTDERAPDGLPSGPRPWAWALAGGLAGAIAGALLTLLALGVLQG